MRTSPDTYVVSLVDARNFVLRLLSVCGVCSSEQAAWVYRHHSRPLKRIWPVLSELREKGYVETRRGLHNESDIHRLTLSARRRASLPPIRWDTRIEHKLAVTDLYVALHAPQYFIREYRQRFAWMGKERILSPDACAMVGDEVILFEVQRTPIETRRWAAKRKTYEQYFATQAWMDALPDKPRVVVVQYANQQLNTIGPGLGYDLTVLHGMEEVRGLGHLQHDREVGRKETREDVYTGRSTDIR